MEEVFCLALYESEKKGEESVKKCLAVYESVKKAEERYPAVPGSTISTCTTVVQYHSISPYSEIRFF